MAIQALAKVTEVDYIIESDRKNEDPTIFKIKPMDGQQYMGVIAEGNTDQDGMITFSERTMRATLRYGLVGWSNFKEGDKDIKFIRSSFGRLPVEVLTEIFSEIIKISAVTEEEIKN